MKDEGFKISVQDERKECLRTPKLSSKQEEADTKMFLAANYACSRGVESVTIKLMDSYVAIQVCCYAPIIESRIIIKIGTGKYELMLNVTESSLDKHLICSLPGLHAFSGRDSASAFYGNGKIKWLNLVKKHEIFCDAICLLDESIDIEETVHKVIEQMVCVAYGFENVEKINEIRYKKCCSKQFPDLTRIPPTRPELRQHVKRVNFQAFIWKKALDVEPLIPNADGYG